MRPGPYFFALGLVVGVAATGSFAWLTFDNRVDEVKQEARRSVCDEDIAQTATELRRCERRANECLNEQMKAAIREGHTVGP